MRKIDRRSFLKATGALAAAVAAIHLSALCQDGAVQLLQPQLPV